MRTKTGMADTTDMAASAFDAACGYCLSKAREDFAKRYATYFSDETDDSICHKARLVRDMQESGMSWSEATDHPDVYLGSEDRDYVSYLLYHWQTSDDPHLSLEAYRHQRLVGRAIDDVRRAITEGGVR
jgi:hypothetical protein